MLSDLNESFGPGCAIALNGAERVYFMIDPHNADAQLGARRLVALMHTDGHINCYAYWEKVEQLMFATWKSMPLGERVEMLARRGIEPASGLEDLPPEGISRDLEDWVREREFADGK